MLINFKYSKVIFYGLLTGLMLFFSGCLFDPKPIVDLPAASLDAIVTVIDVDAAPSDGKAPVVIQFKSNGSFVQLADSATITCNAVTLTYNGLLGYAERVPLQSAGGTYRFSHTRLGITTNIDISVPTRPVITSPTEGAFVTRTNNLTIYYVAGSGDGVKGSAGNGATGLGGNLQDDNGVYTGLDVSTLNAGPGTISITREYNGTLAGTGFHSVATKYSSSSVDINVTWQ